MSKLKIQGKELRAIGYPEVIYQHHQNWLIQYRLV